MRTKKKIPLAARATGDPKVLRLRLQPLPIRVNLHTSPHNYARERGPARTPTSSDTVTARRLSFARTGSSFKRSLLPGHPPRISTETRPESPRCRRHRRLSLRTTPKNTNPGEELVFARQAQRHMPSDHNLRGPTSIPVFAICRRSCFPQFTAHNGALKFIGPHRRSHGAKL